MAMVMKEIEQDSVNQGKDSNNQTENMSPDQARGADSYSKGPVLEPVTEINNGGKGQLDTGVFVPTSPGKYYIMVTALKGKSQNRYSLNVQPFKPQLDVWEPNDTIDKAKVITSGKSIQPTYMGTEDTDWFKIYVPAKGKLKVRLAVPSDIDGVIEIYNPDKTLIRKVDEFMAGGEESAEITVSKIGYYYIKTYDYLGNSSVQPYTLSVSYQKNISRVPNKHQKRVSKS